MTVGRAEGVDGRRLLGASDIEGKVEGDLLGTRVGSVEGAADGRTEGDEGRTVLGFSDIEGDEVGDLQGSRVGAEEGTEVEATPLHPDPIMSPNSHAAYIQYVM